VDDFAKHGMDVIEQMRGKTPGAHATLVPQAMQVDLRNRSFSDASAYQTSTSLLQLDIL